MALNFLSFTSTLSYFIFVSCQSWTFRMLFSEHLQNSHNQNVVARRFYALMAQYPSYFCILLADHSVRFVCYAISFSHHRRLQWIHIFFFLISTSWFRLIKRRSQEKRSSGDYVAIVCVFVCAVRVSAWVYANANAYGPLWPPFRDDGLVIFVDFSSGLNFNFIVHGQSQATNIMQRHQSIYKSHTYTDIQIYDIHFVVNSLEYSVPHQRTADRTMEEKHVWTCVEKLLLLFHRRILLRSMLLYLIFFVVVVVVFPLAERHETFDHLHVWDKALRKNDLWGMRCRDWRYVRLIR